MKTAQSVEKKFKIPHTYVILFIVVLFAVLLTYILPAGKYERVVLESGRTVVNPEVFEYVEDAKPTSFFGLFKSIHMGMVQSASIIFFIFMVGGSFQIVTATKALERGIGVLAKSMRNKDFLMIPVFVIVFGIFGGTVGMGEEAIVFIPVAITLARALGYDAMTGTAMIILGCATGFTAGFMNPFTVGVAQGVAELPTFSGIEFRLVLFAIYVIVTTILIMRYGKKVKLNPESSIVHKLEVEERNKTVDLDNLEPIERKHILVLIVFVVGFCSIIYGVFKYGWYITEISATFIAIGIIGGFLGGLRPSKMAEEFIAGARMIALGALIVGLARTVRVVMDDACVIDTVIYGLANAISSLPTVISSVGMYIVQVIINFFIPSGSGQAATTMPIMSPLADVIGINRQVAVLAFQLGDGITNSIIPTAGSLFACLSIAKIKYDEWVKFVWPIIAVWLGIGIVTMIIGNAINYGPF